MNSSNASVPTTKKAQVVCPVCGMVTYSRGGIHPQCALKQADAPRANRLKSAKKVGNPKAKTRPRAASYWKKTCPKCNKATHVRTATCDCGHRFL